MPFQKNKRLLVGQSINPNLQSSFALTHSSLIQILPNYLQEGDLAVTYNLSSP
jgi:hypothetical protein